MFLYTWLKDLVSPADGIVGGWKALALAALAGGGTQVVTNPIWLVKLRLQSQPHDAELRYTSMIDAMRTIYREEGVRGFWRGITPALIGTSHGAVQMVLYERMRATTIVYVEGHGGVMGAEHYLCLGMASKAIASFVTFPYQLVKARMQVRDHHFHREQSFTGTVRYVWRTDGFKGFFRGVFPASIRSAPHAALMFYGYEWTRSAISHTKF